MLISKNGSRKKQGKRDGRKGDGDHPDYPLSWVSISAFKSRIWRPEKTQFSTLLETLGFTSFVAAIYVLAGLGFCLLALSAVFIFLAYAIDAMPSKPRPQKPKRVDEPLTNDELTQRLADHLLAESRGR